MAYKTELSATCHHAMCQRPAKWRVCNRYSAEVGKFCLRHANERVDELNRAEKHYAEATR